MNNLYFSEVSNSQLDTQYYIDLIYDQTSEKMEFSDILETTFTYLHPAELSEKIKNNEKITYEEYIKYPHFNKHYFSKVGGIDFDKWITLDNGERQVQIKEASDNVRELFTKTIEQISSIQDELLNKLADLSQSISEITDTNSPEYLKRENEIIKLSMFIQSVESTKLKLEQASISIVFEAEKAGLPHNLSDAEVEDLCEQLDQYDTKIHGGKILDDFEHLERCYRVMRTQYEEYKNKNGNNESMSQVLKNIGAKLNPDFIFEKYSCAEKELLPFTQDKTETTNVEDAVKDLNHFCSVAQMNYPVVLSDVSSTTNKDSGLELSKNEAKMILERVLRLAAHEIVCHTTTLMNGKKILGFKGKDYILKEEGLAVLSELLFMYGKNMYITDEQGNTIIDKNKIDILHDPKMLAGEILSGEDFYKFLEDFHEISPDRCHFTARFDRFKRGRPFAKPGTQKKDRGYISGLFHVIDFLNNGGNIHDLELAKTGMGDIEKIKKLYSNLEKLGKAPELLKLHGLHEFIYFRLAVKKLKKEYVSQEHKNISFKEYLVSKGLDIYGGTFLAYFNDKYPMFDANNSFFIDLPADHEIKDKILKEVAIILSDLHK